MGTETTASGLLPSPHDSPSSHSPFLALLLALRHHSWRRSWSWPGPSGSSGGSRPHPVHPLSVCFPRKRGVHKRQNTRCWFLPLLQETPWMRERDIKWNRQQTTFSCCFGVEKTIPLSHHLVSVKSSLFWHVPPADSDVGSRQLTHPHVERSIAWNSWISHLKVTALQQHFLSAQHLMRSPLHTLVRNTRGCVQIHLQVRKVCFCDKTRA